MSNDDRFGNSFQKAWNQSWSMIGGGLGGCLPFVILIVVIALAVAMCSTNNFGQSNTASAPSEQVIAASTQPLDQSDIPAYEQPISQTPLETIAGDQTLHHEPAEETSAPLVESAHASEPEEAKPTLTKYYFQVGTPYNISTVEVSAQTPEMAQEILRNFRGNPPVIQGPSTEVNW